MRYTLRQRLNRKMHNFGCNFHDREIHRTEKHSCHPCYVGTYIGTLKEIDH